MCFEQSAPHERGEDPRELGPNPFVVATDQSYPDPQSSAASETTTYVGDNLIDLDEMRRLFCVGAATN